MKGIIAGIVGSLFGALAFAQDYRSNSDDLMNWQWREYNRQQEERRQQNREGYQNWYMNESLRLQREQNEILKQNQNYYWDGFQWRKK